QPTPLQSGATHASSPVLMVGAKPVKPWLALTAVLFGFFMAVLDMTIMNIAIPSIQSGLKTDLLSTSWVLNAYNLMYAVLLITVGRFADQYGRKRLLLIAMILFSLASLGCALAQVCGRISGAPAMSWLIPIALASFVASLLAGKLSSKVTPYMMCLAGMALVAIGLGLLGLLSPLASFLDIAWRGLLMGGGIGLAFQSLPILSLSQVPHAKLG